MTLEVKTSTRSPFKTFGTGHTKFFNQYQNVVIKYILNYKFGYKLNNFVVKSKNNIKKNGFNGMVHMNENKKKKINVEYHSI